MRRLIACVVAVAFLAVQPSAAAEDMPWDGGLSTTTPFESTVSGIASEFVGWSVSAICDGTTDWYILGALKGFQAETTWGYVDAPRIDWVTLNLVWSTTMHLSPQACGEAFRFWSTPDKETLRTCQDGTVTVYETVTKTRLVKKRVPYFVKKNGKRVKKYKVVTKRVSTLVDVPHEEPNYIECSDWMSVTGFSVQTLAHETMHLFRVRNESQAECYAMQSLAWWAWKLGADATLATQMSADYWEDIYVPYRTGTSYGSPLCVNGGEWDLRKDSDVWP